MLSPPEVLIAFRAFCAPVMFVLACFGCSGPLLAAVLAAGFLSDVLDGIVARRLGCATDALRHADTLVDTSFYVTAAIALRIVVPGVFDAAALPLALLVAIHVSRATFELAKFGRLSAYHMWSSKALGVLIVIAMSTVFVTGRPSMAVPLVLWLGVVNELEGFAASVILPVWMADVPSLAHARRRSRPQQVHRGQPRPRSDDAVSRHEDDDRCPAGGGCHHPWLDGADAIEDRRRQRHQREA
jgi:CDP-diacylglycerol--glycerol-3-phosphate 3-phosphatidyltransferase